MEGEPLGPTIAGRRRRSGFIGSEERPTCRNGHDVHIPSLKGKLTGLIVACSECESLVLVFRMRSSQHLAIEVAAAERASVEVSGLDLDRAIDLFGLDFAPRD